MNEDSEDWRTECQKMTCKSWKIKYDQIKLASTNFLQSLDSHKSPSDEQGSISLRDLEILTVHLREAVQNDEEMEMDHNYALAPNVNTASVDRSEEDSPTTKILKLPVEILTIIAAYQDLETLISLRLTCKKWAEIATAMILKRSTRSINFWYSKHKKKFLFEFDHKPFQDICHNREEKSLKKLLDCLDRCVLTPFPCDKFRFEGGNLGSDEVMKFFYHQNHSVFIRRIGFQFCHGWTKKSKLLQILNRLAPTLEALGVYQLDSILDDEPLVPTLVELENLKSVAFDNNVVDDFEDGLSRNIILKILMASPNLISCESSRGYLDPEYGELLTLTNKLHVAKNFEFWPSDLRTGLDRYENFLNLSPPSLQSLCFAYSSHSRENETNLLPKLGTLLSTLWKLSACTLNKIHVRAPMAIFDSVEWIPLPKVVELRIEMVDPFLTTDSNGYWLIDPETQENNFVLPKSLDWSVILPSLTTISICFHGSKFLFPFDDTRIIGSVKTILLSRQIPRSVLRFSRVIKKFSESWCQRLADLCPNVEQLSIACLPHEVVEVGELMWKYFPILKSIRLTIIVPHGYADDNMCDYPLDVCLTGFSEETCDRLRDGWTFPNLEELRQPLHWLNLKEPVDLQIILPDEDMYSHSILMSEVTKRHALAHKNRLKLRFSKSSDVFVEQSCHSDPGTLSIYTMTQDKRPSSRPQCHCCA